MAKSYYHGSQTAYNSPNQPLFLSSHSQNYVSCIKIKNEAAHFIKSQFTPRSSHAGSIKILNKKEAVMKVGDRYFPITIAEEDPTSLALGQSLHHLYVRHETKLQRFGNIYHTMQLDEKDRYIKVYSRPDGCNNSKKATIGGTNSTFSSAGNSKNLANMKKMNSGHASNNTGTKNTKMPTKGGKEKKKKTRKKKTQYFTKEQRKRISIILIHLLAMSDSKMGKIKQRFESHYKSMGSEVEEEFRILYKYNLLEESVKRVAEISINGTCTLKEEHKKYVTRQLIHDSKFLQPFEKRKLFGMVGNEKKKRVSLEKSETQNKEQPQPPPQPQVQKRKLQNASESEVPKKKMKFENKVKQKYGEVNDTTTYREYKKIFEDKRQEYLALQQKLKPYMNAKEFDTLNKKRKDKNIYSTEKDNLTNEIHHRYLQRKDAIRKDKVKARALFEELDLLKKKIVAFLQRVQNQR